MDKSNIVNVQLQEYQPVSSVERVDRGGWVAFMTAGTFQSGATFGDLQGYQITITADEQNQPLFLPVGDDVTSIGLTID